MGGKYDPNKAAAAAQQGQQPSTASTEATVWWDDPFPFAKTTLFTMPTLSGGKEVSVGAPRNLTITEARQQFINFTPEQLAQFRDQAVRYGRASEDASYPELLSLWNELVDAAAAYRYANQTMPGYTGPTQVSPLDVMRIQAQGLGGENGTGGASTDIGEPQAYSQVTGAYQGLLGRTYPSTTDVAAFRRQSQDISPTEFVLGRHAKEAGRTAALASYDAILAMTGGGQAQ